ncbi:MAG: hypothetical protein QM783_10455 [Phycisphaerales bacterium]
MATPFLKPAPVIHRWSQTLIPTMREAPAEAETPSHVLLLCAGYVRKLGAGIYDYLPLAQRVLTKISTIVRQEMDAAGSREVLLPALLPIELYKDTKRDVDYGDLLFKVTDRKGAVAARPHPRRTDHRGRQGKRHQLQAAPPQSLPDPDQVPRRGPPPRRPSPLPRVHHEGCLHLPHHRGRAGRPQRCLRRHVQGVRQRLHPLRPRLHRR